MSVLGTLAGIGSNIGSAFINNAFSGSAAKKAFNYNKQLLQIQQDWQERMSNTAHQREVADLRAAGLNPILSATGGSGASFGSASAPGMSVGAGQTDSDLGISSALAIKQQKNQNKMTESQTELNDELKRKTGAEWSLIQEQEKNAFEQGLNIIAERNVISANALKAQAEADRQLIENKYLPRYLESQIESNSAGAWYNRHRALGKSRSYSDSSNDSSSIGNFGPGSWLPSKSFNSAYSRSYSETQ